MTAHDEATAVLDALVARQVALDTPEWFSLTLKHERAEAFDAHPLPADIDRAAAEVLLQLLLDAATRYAMLSGVPSEAAIHLVHADLIGKLRLIFRSGSAQ